jgi:hypothetical protein
VVKERKAGTFAEGLLEEVGQRHLEEVHGLALCSGGGLGFLFPLSRSKWKVEKVREGGVEGSRELEMERREMQ